MKSAVNAYQLPPERWTSASWCPAASNACAAIQDSPPGVVPASGPSASAASRSPANVSASRTPGSRVATEPTSAPACIGRANGPNQPR